MRFKGKFQETPAKTTPGRIYPKDALEIAMSIYDKKEDKNWPPKWVDVYPHGSKAGDEEFEFFKILARDPKYDFRSVSSIAKDTGLSQERVEEIIQKYYKKGMLFQKPGNEDFWGYWERVPDMVPNKTKSIGKTDKDQRIKKLLDKDTYSLKEDEEKKDKFKELRDIFEISKSDKGFNMIEIKSTPSESPNIFEEVMMGTQKFRDELEAQWENQGVFSTLISEAFVPEDMQKTDIVQPIEYPLSDITISVASNNEFAWDESFNITITSAESYLGEPDDVEYFRKKIMEGLGLPEQFRMAQSSPQEEWALDL